jgi:hypothetical protein
MTLNSATRPGGGPGLSLSADREPKSVHRWLSGRMLNQERDWQDARFEGWSPSGKPCHEVLGPCHPPDRARLTWMNGAPGIGSERTSCDPLPKSQQPAIRSRKAKECSPVISIILIIWLVIRTLCQSPLPPHGPDGDGMASVPIPLHPHPGASQ